MKTVHLKENRVLDICYREARNIRVLLMNENSLKLKYNHLESVAGLAVKKGNVVYIVKHRARIDTYDDFTKLNWETVSLEHFNSGIDKPSEESIAFYQNKYLIIDLGGE